MVSKGDNFTSRRAHICPSGAVIVSTPQDVALIDVRKGVAMFRKVGIPVSLAINTDARRKANYRPSDTGCDSQYVALYLSIVQGSSPSIRLPR